MSSRLYVGTRKGLFVWSPSGDGWKMETVHFLGEPVTMLLPSEGEAGLFATLTLGHFGVKLRRQRPGASDWDECAVPMYPEGAEVNAGPPTGDSPAKKKPASLTEIWSLETGGADQPGVLWAGTIPGGLFRSTDNGASWQLIESLWNLPERWQIFGGGKDDPGIHSICVDPRDSRHVTIAISCGGVWDTRDNGATWQLLGEGLRAEYMPPGMEFQPLNQDPHRMAACAAQPDAMWIQHHNGVFRSTDGGKHWSELTTPRPSTFGFAVAAHPSDPQTAWFAPAADDQCRVPVDNRFVVSRTRDGGGTFDVLDKGLPAPPAFDIVFRHALAVDRTGNALAVGSTTGGLWASTDGGDRWTCLSMSLPPIYCVRFDGA